MNLKKHADIMRFIKIMFLILRGWHLTLAAPLHIQTIIHKVSNAL